MKPYLRRSLYIEKVGRSRLEAYWPEGRDEPMFSLPRWVTVEEAREAQHALEVALAEYDRSQEATP